MSIADGGGTELVISGPGMPRYAARGLTQSLDPIDAAAVLARTVNGELLNFAAPEFKKYKSTISCTDVEGPAFDALWPGDVLTVDCAKELAYLTITGTPARPVVEGSERVVHDYTYYRPQLVMRVMNYTAQQDEYGHTTQWQLELEEV